MFKVTPWEVSGKIDYQKLIEEFGVNEITDELLQKLPDHFMLRRRIFYAHRDLDKIIESGEKFYLYTGRGPSGKIHIGHLLPWVFNLFLQKEWGTELYFQLTDDEKFLFNEDLSLEDTKKLAYDNALDIIALGFDPEKTTIFLDTDNMNVLYPIAIKVAKRVTFSTAKAVFGFDASTNIGSIFYTSIQSAPAFLLSELEKKSVRCLIPCAIDQDPHFRVTRDVAEPLGYPKPASIYCKLLPSLTGDEKMSSSSPESSIFTTDDEEQVRKKIMNAFTGGAATVKEQRLHGGNPEVCAVYSYHYFFFEPDDSKVRDIHNRCRSGSLLCGECKAMLAEKVNSFLTEHRKKREKARDHIDEFVKKL
ncbi:MAG: tryptophan--tRNA ligase [Candidatus Thermoplasmatota archaeon]|nr:tryptophan--tRNA ligase [Candidatus Thermoplasmatota archaeon]